MDVGAWEKGAVNGHFNLGVDVRGLRIWSCGLVLEDCGLCDDNV